MQGPPGLKVASLTFHSTFSSISVGNSVLTVVAGQGVEQLFHFIHSKTSIFLPQPRKYLFFSLRSSALCIILPISVLAP